ncbi:tail fiber domain-containing protein [Luminiphilus sp. nBUS_07]|uniref:tail fiber domain-containing protein n=1 Tax=Luminiphilus sp. nBUS_07 TaxID=3395314 RepID=UPI003EBB1F37
MIRLLMAGLLLVSVNTVADTQVTHSFKDGDIIEAEEFNKNFDDLEAAIDTLLRSTTEEAIALTSIGGGISLKTNLGTNDTIVVTNSQGDSAESIKLDSIAGGITLSAVSGITLNSGGYGDVTVTGNLIASGSVTSNSVVNSSDARLKEAVSSVGVGLGLINDLNPVRYHRINNPESDIEMGLMAQEVEATLAKHGLGNSGMVVQPDDKGYLYLRYNDLLAPMIKAIQELDDASEAKDEQITSLQQKLESQQEELLAIVQSQQEQIAQLQKLVEHEFAMN